MKKNPEVAKGDSMNTFIKRELIWEIRKVFYDSENPKIPTRSALYNSLIAHHLPKTLIVGSLTSWFKKSKTRLSPRIERWQQKLQGYTFRIEYKEGQKHFRFH
jgi:hypothetical protein